MAPSDFHRLRRKFLQATYEEERMLELALRASRHQAEAGEDFVLGALKKAAREYALWTRKLITVRTLQTITVLDIDCYREMVWEIGGYAEDGLAG